VTQISPAVRTASQLDAGPAPREPEALPGLGSAAGTLGRQLAESARLAVLMHMAAVRDGQAAEAEVDTLGPANHRLRTEAESTLLDPHTRATPR
jgi:hypothetical protein